MIRSINDKDLEDDDDLNITGRWLPKSANWQTRQIDPNSLFPMPEEKPEPIIIYQPPPQIEVPPEIIEEPKIEPPKQGPLRRGIYLKINGLRNFMETNNTKIRVALVDLTNVLLDERSQPCTFETDSYCLPEAENPEMLKYIENVNKNQTIDLSSIKTSSLDKSSNKTALDITFLEMNEETVFVTDIYFYCLINEAWDNIYLIFQILTEKKEEIDPNLHVVDKPLEDGTEKLFQGYTWLPFKVFTNRIMNVGRHLEHNVVPPPMKPPFENELQKTDDVLDFIIQEYMYDINQLDDVYDKLKMKAEQKKRKNLKNKYYYYF